MRLDPRHPLALLARPAVIRPVGDRQIDDRGGFDDRPNPSDSLQKDREIVKTPHFEEQRKEKPPRKTKRTREKEIGKLAITRSHQPVLKEFQEAGEIGTGSGLTISLPLRLSTGQNEREHWAARARRVKAERESVAAAWPTFLVTIVRISPSAKVLDDDNCVAACKAVRDQVAEQLGVDDGDTGRVRFVCKSERGPWGVRIELSFIGGDTP